MFTPIKFLDCYIKEWVIKVRLIKKNEIRTFTSQRTKKQGRLQNLEFMDRFGASIQATLFTEMIVKWENILISNRVYLISKAFVE